MFNFNWFHLNAFFNRWLLWNTFIIKSMKFIANEKKNAALNNAVSSGTQVFIHILLLLYNCTAISMTRTRKPFVMRDTQWHAWCVLVVASHVIALFRLSSHECNYSRTTGRIAAPSKQFYYKFNFNFSLDRCIVAWTNGHGLIPNYLCIFHSLTNAIPMKWNELKSLRASVIINKKKWWAFRVGKWLLNGVTGTTWAPNKHIRFFFRVYFRFTLWLLLIARHLFRKLSYQFKMSWKVLYKRASTDTY